MTDMHYKHIDHASYKCWFTNIKIFFKKSMTEREDLLLRSLLNNPVKWRQSGGNGIDKP